jgi:hypothetical protein
MATRKRAEKPAKKPGRAKPVKRPPRQTECTIGEVAEAIRANGGCLTYAARDLGVTYQTTRNYMKRWPELRKVRREARCARLDNAERMVDQAILHGDPKAAMALLDRLGKKRGYGQQKAVEHTGNVGNKVQVAGKVSLRELNLPAELLQAILEHVRRRKAEQQARQQPAPPPSTPAAAPAPVDEPAPALPCALSELPAEDREEVQAHADAATPAPVVRKDPPPANPPNATVLHAPPRLAPRTREMMPAELAQDLGLPSMFNLPESAWRRLPGW